MPSQVKINNKFEIKLKLRNLGKFDIFNLTITEKIPEGYDLGKEKKISPKPYDIKFENGSYIVYWKIKKLASHKNIEFEYSLIAPKRMGTYTFKANAFGFDTFNNKYAAFNVTKQEVKKSSLWRRSLDFFGFD